MTLKDATYQVTTRLAGNVYAQGLEEFQKYGLLLKLYGYLGDDRVLVVTTATQGVVTKTIEIAKTGVYWINPVLPRRTCCGRSTWWR